MTGERYSYEGEGVLGDYGTMLTEDESESTDWSGSYTCESSGVSVTLSQTDPETFSYAFSDGVSGAATAGKDSAASEDGAIRFLLHEGVLTVIGGAKPETTRWTHCLPENKRRTRSTDTVSVLFFFVCSQK